MLVGRPALHNGFGFVGKGQPKSAGSKDGQPLHSVPGWFSTAIGAFVPAAWVGVTADVMVQLVNKSGDAGRLSLANLAGTVGSGGNVAVVERVGKDKGGTQKFIWAYSHTANLNGKPTTSLLYACSADVVVAP